MIAAYGITYAPYATLPERSRGRLHADSESVTRTSFQRDRDRIVHSAAFRRLKHKTQVFVAHEGDHYRTRLTHSLEVAQIARSIARQLGLNEDLAECLALAHDLGHTPFGHAGEDALNAAMAGHGGFDHNAHTLRIVTALERKYAGFDGLNLTWETLEGIVKHNGPLTGPRAVRKRPLHDTIVTYNRVHDLALDTFAGAEAQVAALADDIAYDTHDIDDGLRAGLFTIDDVAAVPFVGAAFAEVRGRYPNLEQPRLIHEAVRRLVDRMVSDVLAETRRRIEAARPGGVEDIRALGRPVVAFSPAIETHDRALKQFLFTHMYRHPAVLQMTERAGAVVRDLFALFAGDPQRLPEPWRAGAGAPNSRATARLVADYIAGMTDRFADTEHKRLFGDGGSA